MYYDKNGDVFLPSRLPRLYLKHFVYSVEIVFYPVIFSIAAIVRVKYSSMMKGTNTEREYESIIAFEYCEAGITYPEFIICREDKDSFTNLPKEIRKAVTSEIENFCKRKIFTEREVANEIEKLQKELVS